MNPFHISIVELVSNEDTACMWIYFWTECLYFYFLFHRINYFADHYNLDDECWDVHVLTGSLKLFFRELKEPLFTFGVFDRFIPALSKLEFFFRIIIWSMSIRTLSYGGCFQSLCLSVRLSALSMICNNRRFSRKIFAVKCFT